MPSNTPQAVDPYQGHVVENSIHFSTFTVRSKCWQYGTADTYSWAVYIDIKPGNPIFSNLKHIYLHIDNLLDQQYAVDNVLPNLHCGCTFFELTPRFFTAGCDFQHDIDEPEFSNRSTTNPPISVTHCIESLIRFMHETGIRHNSVLFRRFTSLCQP